ncbi:hypothetical protein [Glycomyces luteolus]|uniref:hypothetical protein n=1 Tax=Glycomyces luteolus TaxID=2670330 RepID=UPI0038CC1179
MTGDLDLDLTGRSFRYLNARGLDRERDRLEIRIPRRLGISHDQVVPEALRGRLDHLVHPGKHLVVDRQRP